MNSLAESIRLDQSMTLVKDLITANYTQTYYSDIMHNRFDSYHFDESTYDSDLPKIRSKRDFGITLAIIGIVASAVGIGLGGASIDGARKTDAELAIIKKSIFDNNVQIKNNYREIVGLKETVLQNYQSTMSKFREIDGSLNNISFAIYSTKDKIIDKIEETKIEILHGVFSAINSSNEKIINKIEEIKIEILRNITTAIDLSKVQIIGTIDESKDAILQSIHESRVRPIISHMNAFLNYFTSEIGAIEDSLFSERIEKLSSPNGILEYLQKARIPLPNTLHTLLWDIMEQNFAIPKSVSDQLAIKILELLCYGTRVYILIVIFLVRQYEILSKVHYQNGNVDQFNRHVSLKIETFNNFFNTLVKSKGNQNGLLEMVIDELNDVKRLKFIKEKRKDLVDFINDSIDYFENVKTKFKSVKNGLFLDVPVKMKVRPDFTDSNVTTPIGDWTIGRKVSYAMQFKDEQTNVLTKIGDWSIPFTIDEHANPFISILLNLPGKTRLIFRKFDQDQPQLVATINDSKQKLFRDIDRDLFNAASEPNKKLAMRNAQIYIQNGANVNATFDNGRSVIHAAVDNNNIAMVQALIQKGCDINAKDSDGFTAVHIAVESEHEQLLKILIENGAFVNSKTSSDTLELSPIHIASYKGNVILVDHLLSAKGVNIKAKSKTGLNALHMAAIQNHDETFKKILATGQIDVNSMANNNVSPLHLAAAFGSKKLVTTMLENGADQSAQTVDGSIALHFAALLYNPQIVQNLSLNRTVNIDTLNNQERTPLYVAFKQNNTKSALALINNCANIQIRLSEGKTLLHLAAMNGDVEVVANLIENGINGSVIDEGGRMPIHFATKNSHLEIVHILLRHKSDLKLTLNHYDNSGMSPLFYAISSNSELLALKLVKRLTDAGADIYTPNDDNFSLGQYYSICHIAIAKGYLLVVEFIISLGYDVNRVDKYGNTALHYSSAYGNLDITRFLIAHGAQINAVNSDQESPLFRAVESNNNFELVKFLIAKNASISVKAKFGMTILHNALFSNNTNSAHYLVQQGLSIQETVNYNSDILNKVVENSNLNLTKLLYNEKTYPNLSKELLFHAVQAGNLEIIKYLINYNNSNIIESVGKYLVYYALTDDKFEMLQYLIEKGADFKVKNFSGLTALHKAAFEGNSKAINYLLSNGALINAKDDSGETPLFCAINGKGRRDVVKLLVEKGANVHDKLPVFDEGTAHRAIAANKTDVFMYLIDKNVDVNVNINFSKNQNSPRRTALLHAAYNGNTELVKYLIDSNSKINVDFYDFMSSAIEGSATLDLIKNFVSKQITEKNTEQNSLVHKAVELDKVDIVKYLIDHQNAEYKMPMTYGSFKGYTPLHIATEKGNLEIIKLLVGRNADVNVVNENGHTPYELALRGKKENVIKYFIFDYRNEKHQSMLHLLAIKNKLKLIKLSLERGANVNALDGQKQTSLHLAAQKGHLDVVKLLCENRCIDASALDANNQTALNLARDNYKQLVEYFLEDRFQIRKARSLVDQAVKSGAHRPTWFVLGIASSFTNVIKVIGSKISQNLNAFHSYAPNWTPNNLSIVSNRDIDVSSTLLLADVLIKSKTGRKYIPTCEQLISPMEYRIYSLNLTEQFEFLIKNTTAKCEPPCFDSFELYKSIERYMFSGQFHKIDQALHSIAHNCSLSLDDNKTVHRDIDRLLIKMSRQNANDQQTFSN